MLPLQTIHLKNNPMHKTHRYWGDKERAKADKRLIQS
jgi:hypothetical protein